MSKMHSLSIILFLSLVYNNAVIIDCSSCPFTQDSAISDQEDKSTNESSTDQSDPNENSELKCSGNPSSCPKTRYRSIDGSCNNKLHPGWGTPQTPYALLVPRNYGDGISSFPRSTSGKPLPNARAIRLKIFPNKLVVDPRFSLITMQWGQVVTHDLSLTAGVPQTRKDPFGCCNSNGTVAADTEDNPLCAPIIVSRLDPVYGPYGKTCIDLVRTRSSKDNNCTAADVPAEPLTSVTSYMDLSLVYGTNKTQLSTLREGRFGRLKTEKRNGQDWPPQDPVPTLTCDTLKTPTSPCYLTGDVRTNQNPQLALLQVILLREHNRIADTLVKLNPHWTDETLFQEARRISIAIFQHINYYEYLPNIIGLDNMVKNKLISPNAKGYVDDYNANVNPSVFNEHASAAFRIFHSSIRGYLDKYTDNRILVGEARLSDSINNPTVLEEDDGFDRLTRGLATQSQSCSDQYFTSEVTNYIFKNGNDIGEDLRSIDIQRSRDHGLGNYVDVRAACGLSVPKKFSDMTEYISVENVRRLRDVYETLEDVELLVAGSLEKPVPRAQVGPTFLRIITMQFYKTRISDRFFYESNADPDVALTLSQLGSIRQGASLARLLCDNAAGVQSMQPKVFQSISDTNKIVSCDQLPFVNLTLWKKENFC